jgi:peptide/nickel transport system ATP-binding protein
MPGIPFTSGQREFENRLDYSGMALLEVRGLKTYFRTTAGLVRAVDGISFSVEEGEVLALVGESGSGKSVTSLSILGLVPRPAGFHAGGEILFRGRDLAALAEKDRRPLRGRDISLVFQDPANALNPVMSCGDQVAEGLRLRGASAAEARAKALALFREVGIPDPERRLREYPHEMSGGMRQRVVIAMALAGGPALLVADEPTTALDVTVQAQILELLLAEREARGMGLLLITHDLGVVAETADRVAVMYAGKIVETGAVEEIFNHPRHPYTRALLDAVPALAPEGAPARGIEGTVPDPSAFPSGCRFHPRCPRADARCAAEEPAFNDPGDRGDRSGGGFACHHPLEAA